MRRAGGALLFLLFGMVAVVVVPTADAVRVQKNRAERIHQGSDSTSIHSEMREPRDQDHQSRGIRYTEEAEDDRVDHLPGWGNIDSNKFEMFSGYVTVDKAAGRALFYVFVTSSRDPVNDPLLLWLNGGPGCSSLGGGFLAELGPFLPEPGGTTLQSNPYAWNKVANVLFVESPAFVGFSYSNTSADAIVGDQRTAEDLRKFLLGFVQRFPHLAENDLYLSGESYAGHYVPGLAYEIVKGNRLQIPKEHLNLAGFLVGNPWTDTAIDNLGAVDYWWAHALISDTTAKGIKTNCNFSHIGPLDAHPEHANPASKEELCDKFCNTAMEELGPINIYQIYADTCPPARVSGPAAALAAALSQPSDRHIEAGAQASKTAKTKGAGAATGKQAVGASGSSKAVQHTSSTEGVHAGALGAAHALSTQRRREAAAVARAALAAAGGNQKHASARMSRDEDKLVREEMNGHDSDDGDDGGMPPEPAYDPCIDNEVETYLNLPEVQRALHANVSGNLPGPWTDCTRHIKYSREDLLSSMLPIWDELLWATASPSRSGGAPLRFLVYSGDVDGIVPVVGTRRWVAGLGLREVAAWRPWLSGGTSQVGGYVVGYDLPGSAHSSSSAARSSFSKGNGKGVAGLQFATVRNAGHMVPYVQPQRALHLVTHFLENKPL